MSHPVWSLLINKLLQIGGKWEEGPFLFCFIFCVFYSFFNKTLFNLSVTLWCPKTTEGKFYLILFYKLQIFFCLFFCIKRHIQQWFQDRIWLVPYGPTQLDLSCDMSLMFVLQLLEKDTDYLRFQWKFIIKLCSFYGLSFKVLKITWNVDCSLLNTAHYIKLIVNKNVAHLNNLTNIPELKMDYEEYMS